MGTNCKLLISQKIFEDLDSRDDAGFLPPLLRELFLSSMLLCPKSVSYLDQTAARITRVMDSECVAIYWLLIAHAMFQTHPKKKPDKKGLWILVIWTRHLVVAHSRGVWQRTSIQKHGTQKVRWKVIGYCLLKKAPTEMASKQPCLAPRLHSNSNLLLHSVTICSKFRMETTG